jgi:SAM-dependent methyltransferase
MTSEWINGEWVTAEYQKSKKFNFQLIIQHLENVPKKILDIGCGLAWESRLLNQYYNSELWLVDGDINDNDSKDKGASLTNYHTTANDFLFYHPLSMLDTELKKLGTTNYHLINCNVLNIPDDIKFDLITSYLSCGFHYPVSTYKELFLKHSNENTKIIVDIRTELKSKKPIIEDGVEIVKVLYQHRKHMLTEIKLI